MAYTNIFGGSTVQPSDVSYQSLNLTANYQFSWPQTNQDNDTVIARINDIITTSGLSLAMPDATLVSPGQDALFMNSGANIYTVTDFAGSTITTVASGQMKYVYLKDNTTAAGVWGVVTFGVGASSPDAATLAGLGLKALNVTLNQNYPVSTKNATYLVLPGDRASCLQWTGGTGTFTLTAAATLTSGWFAQIKNSGSGTLTLDPNATETIDGNLTLNLNPQESLIIVCDGVNFFTIGRGQQLTDTFTRLVKSVAGSSNVTLTASEAAYDLIEFTGTLTGNISVNFPNSVNRWYIFNNTTGAFTLTTKTTSGTGVVFPQATHNIINSDGTNMFFSVATGTGTVTSIGTGTGLTGGPITTSGSISVATNGITDALFRQSAALTVVGNASNATANTADIAFGTDGFVLKRSGTSLVTGLITTANITALNITTALINNLAVTTGKLDNLSVTVAKMSSGAATVGQVATADGSGNVSYVSPSGGNAPLDTKIAFNSSSLDFTSSITSTNSEYVLKFVDVILSGNTANFTLLGSINGGSSYLSSYQYRNFCFRNGSTFSFGGQDDAGAIFLIAPGFGLGANGLWNGEIVITNPGGTTSNKGVESSFTVSNSGASDGGILTNGGYIKTTSAVNAFRIIPDSGLIVSGTIYMYARPK